MRLRGVPAEARFMYRVELAGECWRWTGMMDRHGYARFPFQTIPGKPARPVPGHRWAYKHFIGPIPDGLQLDHLCRNRWCVNPAHLEPVTCQENLRRGNTLNARNLTKTHCPKGHPYSEENTRLSRTRTDNGQRRTCIACTRVRDRETKRRKVSCPDCGSVVRKANLKRHRSGPNCLTPQGVAS